MPLTQTTIRLDPELLAATRAEARRLGIDWSEYVRQALAYRLGWSAALNTAAAASGVNLGVGDMDELARRVVRRLAEPDDD